MKASDFTGKGSEFIVDALFKNAGTPPSPGFIVLKECLKAELNRELIESQKTYQDDSVKQMRRLVYATWALAIVTLLIILLKH
jgi:hypothetical protein